MQKVKQSPATKLLIAAIQTAPDKRLQISYRDLADRLFITIRSSQKLVKRLEQAGLLKVERPDELWIPNTYSINQTYFQLLQEQNNV